MCTVPQLSTHCATLPLINGGCVCTLTSRQSSRAPGISQVWLVYFQVWTGRSLKTEPNLVSYLNSTPPRPRPWQRFHACTSCLSLVGHANLSLVGGPECFGSVGCVSVSLLMEAMCLQDGKKPALASEGARHVLP